MVFFGVLFFPLPPFLSGNISVLNCIIGCNTNKKKKKKENKIKKTRKGWEKYPSPSHRPKTNKYHYINPPISCSGILFVVAPRSILPHPAFQAGTSEADPGRRGSVISSSFIGLVDDVLLLIPYCLSVSVPGIPYRCFLFRIFFLPPLPDEGIFFPVSMFISALLLLLLVLNIDRPVARHAPLILPIRGYANPAGLPPIKGFKRLIIAPALPSRLY